MDDEYEYGWGSGCFIHFDGNYGRTGTIQVTDTVCAGCRKAAMCLHVDQSEGEYHPGTVCRDCIEKLFAGGDK